MSFAYGMNGALQIYQQRAPVVVDIVYDIVWVLKKGGIVSIRHNNLRGATANMLSEVCKDRSRAKINTVNGRRVRQQNCKHNEWSKTWHLSTRSLGKRTTSIFQFMEVWGNVVYSRLSNLLSEKRDLPKSITMNWIRTKIFFALLKSCLLCLGGSRTVCRKVANFESDVVVSEFISRI